MSKNKQIEDNLKNQINSLEKEELKLFHSYNRHAKSEVKLSVLASLQTVIIKLETLKNLL